ncbi:MAG: hypothetical protein LBV17_02355 [Treponema sp.]|jgi:hypothetical protein|nr:hypothetical protein [Treponema sp.]
MNIIDIKQQVGVFEKTRKNLLTAIIFTVINIILALINANVYFPFSATLPLIVLEMGRSLDTKMGSPIFLYIGLIIAFFIILLYFIFWILSKKIRVLILVVLIFFCIDSLFLIYLIINSELEISTIIEIVFHFWVLYYLIIGTKTWLKLRSVSTEEYYNILNEKSINSPDISISNDQGNEEENDDETKKE